MPEGAVLVWSLIGRTLGLLGDREIELSEFSELSGRCKVCIGITVVPCHKHLESVGEAFPM